MLLHLQKHVCFYMEQIDLVLICAMFMDFLYVVGTIDCTHIMLIIPKDKLQVYPQ